MSQLVDVHFASGSIVHVKYFNQTIARESCDTAAVPEVVSEQNSDHLSDIHVVMSELVFTRINVVKFCHVIRQLLNGLPLVLQEPVEF